MSSTYRSVIPHIDGEGAIRLPRNQINEFVRNHYSSDEDWWQAAFRTFGYMTVNRAGKYTVTGIYSNPRFFRKYESCILYSSNGGVKSNTRSVDACHMYLKDNWCADDLLGDCYHHLLQYDSSGDAPSMTPEADRLYGQYMAEMAWNYKKSMHLTLALGNAFPDISGMFADGLDWGTRKDLEEGANNTCDGWFTQWLIASQSGKSHLNVQGVINQGEFAEGCEYNGNIHEAIKKLICAAKPKLKRLINGGNYGTPSRVGSQAQIVVDCDFYQAVIDAYDYQCQLPAQNCELITKRAVTALGVTKDVYYIKGMPVVELASVSGLNEFLQGSLRFIGIVGNGYIQLGNSMGDLSEGRTAESTTDVGMSMKIWKNEGQTPINIYDSKGNIKDVKYMTGDMHTSTHALTRTVLVDTDCMVGSFVYDPGTPKVI